VERVACRVDVEGAINPMRGLRIERWDSDADPAGVLTLLQAIRDIVLEHRWSVSSTELWMLPDSPAMQVIQAETSRDGVVWLSGAEILALAACIAGANWGAFLAFPPHIEVVLPASPRSEGKICPIQHSLANIEIQAVDGGYFEVCSKMPEVYFRLRQRFTAEEF
jgi:hypothetical protein